MPSKWLAYVKFESEPPCLVDAENIMNFDPTSYDETKTYHVFWSPQDSKVKTLREYVKKVGVLKFPNPKTYEMGIYNAQIICAKKTRKEIDEYLKTSQARQALKQRKNDSSSTSSKDSCFSSESTGTKRKHISPAQLAESSSDKHHREHELFNYSKPRDNLSDTPSSNKTVNYQLKYKSCKKDVGDLKRDIADLKTEMSELKIKCSRLEKLNLHYQEQLAVSKTDCRHVCPCGLYSGIQVSESRIPSTPNELRSPTSVVPRTALLDRTPVAHSDRPVNSGIQLVDRLNDGNNVTLNRSPRRSDPPAQIVRIATLLGDIFPAETPGQTAVPVLLQEEGDPQDALEDHTRQEIPEMVTIYQDQSKRIEIPSDVNEVYKNFGLVKGYKSDSKGDSAYVGDFAEELFGTDTLLTHSVSGKQSNANKAKEGLAVRPALNKKHVEAVKSVFEVRLRKIMANVQEGQAAMTQEDLTKRFKKSNSYIAHRIENLIRTAKKNK